MKKRIYWLDICRSIAIWCVVLCHSVEAVFQFDLESVQTMSIRTSVFVFSMFTIGRIGVPLFLFISGYLLLKGKMKYDSKECIFFWKRNLFSLLLTAEIWNILYIIFLSWYNGENVSLMDLILNIFFMKNVDLSHVWYMPMILGVYLFIPFLSNLMDMFSNKIWITILIVIYIYSFCAVPLNLLFALKAHFSLIISPPTFIGGYYGVYLVLGYLVKKDFFSHIKNRYLFSVGTVTFVCAVLFQIYIYKQGIEYMIWYNSPFLLICTLCIFIGLSKYGNKIDEKPILIWNNIAQSAFGIYLVHNLIIKIIKKYVNIEISNLFCVLLLSVLVFGLSYIIVRVGSKNKYIGKYLFLMK